MLKSVQHSDTHVVEETASLLTRLLSFESTLLLAATSYYTNQRK